MIKALFSGLLASLFFAATFVLNRKMQLSGGYWIWSACLRFYFMVPLLLVPVLIRKKYTLLIQNIRNNFISWFIWSTVGFGFFYSFLCAASSSGPAWMVAASWQITIVCGVLLTPFFKGAKIPKRQFAVSCVILCGVALVQISHVRESFSVSQLYCIFLILIAAFSYPLGNRKMMNYISSDIGTIERVFGMTICSLPFWFVLSGYAAVHHQYPSQSQIFQSFIVALFSGVIATILFFRATDLVKHNVRQLAGIESTQAGEVLFSLAGGVILLHDQLPGAVALVGILIIICGIIANAFAGVSKSPSE